MAYKNKEHQAIAARLHYEKNKNPRNPMEPITDELIRRIAESINEDEIDETNINMLHTPMSDEVRELLDDEPRFLSGVAEITELMNNAREF